MELFDLYASISKLETKKENGILDVISLFSGCGGMDLGFEGDFDVLMASVNEKLTPHFIES